MPILLLIKSELLPKKYPTRIKIVDQSPAPRIVNKQNLEKFILKNPAGSEIKCLVPGISLPIKVVIPPYLLKKTSEFFILSLLTKRIFPYFETKISMAALPRNNARK